jgi:hypothetical protein
MAEPIINLAACFQYPAPLTGDVVTKAPMDEYVVAIGNKVCNLVTLTQTNTKAIASLSTRVSALEVPATPYQLPSLYPTGIANPNVSIGLVDFVKALESQFVQERTALGTPQDIYAAIAVPPVGLNNAKALGTTGGNLSALPGWVPSVVDLSDSLINLWMVALDLRSAVANIQLNLGNLSCAAVEIVVSTTYQSKVLTIFFTGNIPTTLANCVVGGSLFDIADYSGNKVSQQIDVITNMNNASGVVIDLSATALNFSDDLKVSSTYCLGNQQLGSTCQKYIYTDVVNSSSCPVLTLNPDITAVTFSFVHSLGTLTYSVELYDSTNTKIQSQNTSVSSPTTVSGQFLSLTANTQYKVRIVMITSTTPKACAFTTFTTLPTPCPAANNVLTSLEYV